MSQEYVIGVMGYVKHVIVNIIVLHASLGMHMKDIVIVHVQEEHMQTQSPKSVKIAIQNVHNVSCHPHIVPNAQVDSMYIKEIVHQNVHQELIRIMHNVYHVHFHV